MHSPLKHPSLSQYTSHHAQVQRPSKNPHHQQNTTSDGQHPTQIVKHIPNQTPKIATSRHNSLYRQKTNSKLKHHQEPPMLLWSKIEG